MCVSGVCGCGPSVFVYIHTLHQFAITIIKFEYIIPWVIFKDLKHAYVSRWVCTHMYVYSCTLHVCILVSVCVCVYDWEGVCVCVVTEVNI